MRHNRARQQAHTWLGLHRVLVVTLPEQEVGRANAATAAALLKRWDDYTVDQASSAFVLANGAMASVLSACRREQGVRVLAITRNTKRKALCGIHPAAVDAAAAAAGFEMVHGTALATHLNRQICNRGGMHVAVVKGPGSVDVMREGLAKELKSMAAKLLDATAWLGMITHNVSTSNLITKLAHVVKQALGEDKAEHAVKRAEVCMLVCCVDRTLTHPIGRTSA